MATTKEVQFTGRVQGSDLSFGTIGPVDMALQQLFDGKVSQTLEVPETLLNQEVSFAHFENGYATFVAVVAENPIKVRINAAVNDEFSLPDKGVLIIGGTGVSSVFISGVASFASRALIFAVGD